MAISQNNHLTIRILSCGALLLCLAACSGGKNGDTADSERLPTLPPEQVPDVTTQVLRKREFTHELISNGKISAAKQAELRFETSEVIAHVYVKNGDRVRQGQKLAELDRFRLAQQLAQADDALLKARLELQDVLIGQGYAANDSARVPAETMKIARVRSGYDQAVSAHALARRALDRATLTAPFDGVVANLFAKPYNLSSTTEAFCAVVATSGMEADFTVLENELPFIKIGDEVMVTPYAGGEARVGRVSAVNPLVDADGMVKVRATVNGDGRLFGGMNVRVSVRRDMGRQLVIPKTAVVLRSGRQVVFTLKNGRAMWNYVRTGLENATECVVSDRSAQNVDEGLVEGDTVIVTGNLNLAHDTKIEN
jgi:RND family efflux transporter MFP subunit